MKKLLYLTIILQLFIGCKEEEVSNPFITEAMHITSNSVVLRGHIGDGISNEYGLLMYEAKNPTFLDKTSSLWGERKELLAFITNLKPDTKYYFHMFVKNGTDMVLSEIFFVQTKPKLTFSDSRDNRVYEYVQIGSQKWMAENLDFKTPNAVYYNHDSISYRSYGRLYSWEEAKSACPQGWHLPSDSEWFELERAIGIPDTDLNTFNRSFSSQYGSCLLNFEFVSNYSSKTTNEFGFNAKPSGYFSNSDNSFSNLNLSTDFWTSTYSITPNGTQIVSRHIDNSGAVLRNNSTSNCKYSIRCVKDE